MIGGPGKRSKARRSLKAALAATPSPRPNASAPVPRRFSNPSNIAKYLNFLLNFQSIRYYLVLCELSFLCPFLSSTSSIALCCLPPLFLLFLFFFVFAFSMARFLFVMVIYWWRVVFVVVFLLVLVMVLRCCRCRLVTHGPMLDLDGEFGAQKAGPAFKKQKGDGGDSITIKGNEESRGIKRSADGLSHSIRSM